MLKKSVNIHEAKTQLSKYIQFAAHGNEVIICRAGKPLVKLSSLETKQPKKRRAGTLAGKITIADDFEEMPDSFMKHFR